MGLLRHLDKIIFLAILALTIWYGVSRYRELEALGVRGDDQSLQIRQLADAVEKNLRVPPPQEAERYSVPAIKPWGRPRPATELSARHFYPGAPEPKRRP